MAKLRLHGREYEIPADPDLGEQCEIQKITGRPPQLIDEIGPLEVLAFAYIAIRRVDKTVTVEALKKLRVQDLEFVADEQEAASPPATTPTVSGESGTSSSASSSNGSGDYQAATRARSGVPT